MGVPHLFRHLSRRCPRAVQVISGGSSGGDKERVGCKELHVDFNSVVHSCARACLCLPPSASSGDGRSEYEGRVIAACLRHLDYLAERLGPTDLVFVAVDGPPPRAKMHQQRARRFVSVHRVEDGVGPSGQAQALKPWDTNAVTPGTSFMERLAAAMEDEAVARATRGVRPTLVVSGHTEPGEGEQKIFERLRRDARGVPGPGHAGIRMVYGLDADLLLMAMAHPMRGSIRVVREQDLGGPLQIVDTMELARHAAADVLRACGPGLALTEAERIDEYVALCALLGNDFVPALPGLRIREGGVDAVLRAYGTVVASGDLPPPASASAQSQSSPGMSVSVSVSASGEPARPRRLASGGPDALGGLDPVVLSAIAEVLARDEGRALEDCERRHADAITRAVHKARGAKRGASGRMESDADAYADASASADGMHSMRLEEAHPLLQPASGRPGTNVCVRPGQPGWRPRYYRRVLSVAGAGDAQPSRSDAPVASEVRAMCVEYAAAIAWSSAYLARQRCLSWGWHYRHAHAPTAYDVHLTLAGRAAALGTSREAALAFEAADAAHLSGERAAGSREAWQLLLVLPPQSSSLLPERVAPVVRTAALGCAHMFPGRFRLCVYLRERLHECPPLLPELDARLLVRALQA